METFHTSPDTEGRLLAKKVIAQPSNSFFVMKQDPKADVHFFHFGEKDTHRAKTNTTTNSNFCVGADRSQENDQLKN